MRRRIRPDSAEAFLPDPAQGVPSRTEDILAETLAEEFVESATGAEQVEEDVRDAFVPEELGGPFVEHSAAEEFDRAPDESNPPGAEREPFPQAVRVPYR